MSLHEKRLEHQKNLTNDRENVTQRALSSTAGLSGFQKEDGIHLSNSGSVEDSVMRGTDETVTAGPLVGSGKTEESSESEISDSSRNDNSRRQDATRLSRRADPAVSGSGAAARPGVTASGTEGRKKQFLSISRRNRKRQVKRYAATHTEPDVALRDGTIHVSASEAENQIHDKYHSYNSEISQKGQTNVQHRPRHYHARRHRHRRRHHRRDQSEDDGGTAADDRSDAYYGLTQLLPPGEKRESANWRKNDQRNRRELADPFLATGDWRGTLRRSYFGALFWGLNNRERWQRLKPRPDPKKSLKSEAEDFGFNVGSENAATPPPGTKIRGSSGKESQKSSRFLRRRRSVSKFAQETKAKMKTKRQNLRAALNQRCGRTGAGLLRSCGEPEMNCKPGKGQPGQAEMVHGSCDGFDLDANQSSSAEQKPLAEDDRGPRSYMEQDEDTALVMVSDAGEADGGSFQRRRRELGNLSGPPNVTYRCSPSHKYWLFASRWVRPRPEGEWTRWDLCCRCFGQESITAPDSVLQSYFLVTIIHFQNTFSST